MKCLALMPSSSREIAVCDCIAKSKLCAGCGKLLSSTAIVLNAGALLKEGPESASLNDDLCGFFSFTWHDHSQPNRPHVEIEESVTPGQVELGFHDTKCLRSWFDSIADLLDGHKTVPQAEIDEWCDRIPAPPLEGLVPPNEMAEFRNRSAIEKANSCACYGCLATFDASEVTKWTDDGQTAICPRCGIDSVLAQTEPEITMEQLQAKHQEAFGTGEI